MIVIDSIAPCKSKWVKANTQNLFDGEVLEKLRSSENLPKAVKKTRLPIDKELYEKAKYDVLKLIAAKKQALFDKKTLRKCWQTNRIMEHPEISWYAQENGSFKLLIMTSH